jgi:hypothetical protein
VTLQVRAAITQETISHERTIDAELEDMLAARGELERELVELHASSEVLELVKADAETMVSSIASTCELAQSVSQKVPAASPQLAATTTRSSTLPPRRSLAPTAETIRQLTPDARTLSHALQAAAYPRWTAEPRCA